ncbi:MAG: hypothetical protein PHX08_06835 [Lachnospiraceae bacterium]|nr:hypothetical protein [Lachnospiraceae bacterium]
MSKNSKKQQKTIILYWNYRKKGFDYVWWIYRDAIEKKRTKIVCPPFFLQSEFCIEWYMQHAHSKSLLKNIWYVFFLFGIGSARKNNYVFLINDQCPYLCDLQFLDLLKRKYNAKLVLTIRNMIKNKERPMLGLISAKDAEKYFDLIVTDELEDSKLYGYPYFPDTFTNMYKKEIKVKYDLCFCGADKKRLKLVKEIYKLAEAKGIKTDFRIVEDNKKNIKGIKYVEWQPYPEVVKQDLQSNCILEILQPGQTGFTLRTQEAICCNKKLLTNNKEIVNNKYYNPKYMQIFERIEDIDFEFIKKRENVDYHYENDFSSINFLREILCKLRRNTK